MAITEWNIQSRSTQCQSCARNFEDKESFHTLLMDEGAIFRRLDICQPCWEREYEKRKPEDAKAVSHWQSTFHVPPPPPPEPIQHETAESLLRKLIETNDDAQQAARYILAVMLERKRILKVKDQIRENGTRVFVYEHARTGDVFTIADPNIQLDQLENVQRQVNDLLNPPAPTPEAPPASADSKTSETEADAAPAQ